MKSFLHFLKEKDPVRIDAMPMHGSHSVHKSDKPVKITAQPMHGKHSKLQESKETSWLDKNDNTHLGASHVEIDKKLHDHNFAKHPQKKALDSYTDDSYDINRALIEKNKNHKNHIAQLSKAVSNSPLHHDIHVYHGTNGFHPGNEAKKHKEGHIHLPAFTSTTIDKHMAHSFANFQHEDTKKTGHILHIHVKKGQHGKYIGSHSKNEHGDNEHEMLLQKGLVLKVHPKPKKLADGTHIWHSHIIHEDHT